MESWVKLKFTQSLKLDCFKFIQRSYLSYE
jgi:hypothetical protein